MSMTTPGQGPAKLDTMKTTILTSIILFLTSVAHAEDPIEKKLQQALFAEEGKRDLDQAIEAYNAVIADYDAQRKFAATAVFRLAECHRKKDQNDQAVAAYRRLLKEFPEEETLVRLANENLATLGASVPAETELATSASEAAEIARIKKLVKLSPDLLNDGDTALLYEAASRSQLQIAKFLIDNGAKVSVGKNVKDLVALGLVPYHPVVGGNGVTPLSIAAANGHLAMVELLIREGAKPDAVSYLLAVRNLRSAVFSELLKHLPENGGEMLAASVHAASEKSRPDYIKQLLAHGAPADFVPSGRDTTQTMVYAVQRGDHETVKLLLGAGAEADRTLLSIAIERGYRKVFDLLWESGGQSPDAFRSAVYSNADTFRRAVRQGGGHVLSAAEHLAFSKHILSKVEDIEQPDSAGMTPLSRAAHHLDLKLIDAVLERGADPDGRSTVEHLGLEEATAIMLALRANLERDQQRVADEELAAKQAAVVRRLLAAGADLDAQDASGFTALHLSAMISGLTYPSATSFPAEPAIEALLEAGPDVMILTDQGHRIDQTGSPLIRSYYGLRRPDRGDWIWVRKGSKQTPVFDRPASLGELLHQHRSNFEPEHLTVYRAGSDDPEPVDYTEIAASGDQSQDIELGPGAIIDLGRDAALLDPDLLKFLTIAASKRVTVNFGEHSWAGTAFPSLPGAHTYDPAVGGVHASTLGALLDAIHAPQLLADLSEVEVAHRDGTRTNFNLLLAREANQLDLMLLDGDTITLRPTASGGNLNYAIWLARESDLFMHPLVLNNEICDIDLAEFISMAYSDSRAVLRAPDLSRIAIRRGDQLIEVNFLAIAADEIPDLELGDIVNIPAVAEPDPEWSHLDEKTIMRLQTLLARRAKFQVAAGGSREHKIGPQFWQFPIEDGLRWARKLDTPHDGEFELLGLSMPAAVRALGYQSDDKVNVAYSRVAPEPRVGFGLLPTEEEHRAIPAPLIKEGYTILIEVGAAQRGKPARRVPSRAEPSRVSGRRVVLPPKGR